MRQEKNNNVMKILNSSTQPRLNFNHAGSARPVMESVSCDTLCDSVRYFYHLDACRLMKSSHLSTEWQMV